MFKFSDVYTVAADARPASARMIFRDFLRLLCIFAVGSAVVMPHFNGCLQTLISPMTNDQ
jgi:hypothetical protein